MTDTNLLIIMDDEHSGNALGCAGHPFVKTPNLDRLAARGTRFRDAYTNSPICVPARAALVTGEYPHKTGCWDNCIAYDGKVRSWGHELQDAGLRTDWIGKQHYLQKPGQLGFDREQLPMWLLNHGDTHGLIRDDPLRRPQSQSFAEKIGPGETEYIEYDRAIRDTACQWLPEDTGRPVFSEYHATAAKSGEFMIRRGRYKYIHYAGFAPELYDLETDADELKNLALDPAYSGILAEFERQLRDIIPPEEADARAKRDQGQLIKKLGGRQAVAEYLSPAATPAPALEMQS